MLIHVLVAKDDGRYHAHALEFDLMSPGDSIGASIDNLGEHIEVYLDSCRDLGLTFDEALRRAPQKFFDSFEETFFYMQAGECIVGRVLRSV